MSKNIDTLGIKIYAYKYQGIIIPDGLMLCLDGPYFGETKDWKVWQESQAWKALQILQESNLLGELLNVYGDLTYVLSFGAICNFKA